VEGQLGLEEMPEEYVRNLVEVFREVWRVLKEDGVLWVNLADSYASNARRGGARHGDTGIDRAKRPIGLKPKDLVGIPWRVAFALRDDGWYLRSDIIWYKPNAMPESVRDRPTRAHEYLFLLTKSRRYYYDAKAIREPHEADSLDRVGRGRSSVHKWADGGPGHQTLAKDISRACHPDGRNKRTVWTIPTKPYKEAHFAAFPPKLPRTCIKAGSRVGDLILDPFVGSGTTILAALELQRRGIGLDLAYQDIAGKRQAQPEMFA
jgi:DNA modification methylase